MKDKGYKKNDEVQIPVDKIKETNKHIRVLGNKMGISLDCSGNLVKMQEIEMI